MTCRFSTRECRLGRVGWTFFVEEVVLLELKAVSALDNVHLVQLRNYLQVFRLEVGSCC